MERIFTPNAPAPVGHYEQGWKHGNLVFVSGQLPVNPETKEKCTGTVAEQATQSLKNVKAVLEAAGTSLDRVLKVTVYISNIRLWDEVNAVHSEFFGDHKPARSIIPTRDLHYGFKIEIEAIAAI